jgi:uncharacterized protein (TIGR04168 family)
MWDQRDSDALDALAYDLVLFVGDLPTMLHRDALDVARRIATLRTRALLIPGNHDGTSPFGVLAEAVRRATARPGLAARVEARLDALQEALGPVAIAGYSVHPFPELTVIAARPHAMDGHRLSFAPAVEALHGVSSLAGSMRRLRELVGATSGDLLFVAHNGPLGLGSDPRAPFALRRGTDLGDPDLADAVAWARRDGHRVRAVVAGHLHHTGGDSRRWQVERDDTLYVNAARVPRIFERDGVVVRHHVALTIEPDRVSAREVLLPDG